MNNYEPFDTPTAETKKSKAGKVLFIILMVLAVLAWAGRLIYDRAVVGQPSTDVTVTSVSLTDRRLQLTGTFNGFAGMKDFSFEEQGDIVLIQLTSVWPLPDFDRSFEISVYGDFSDVSEIDLTDGRISMVVWAADDPIAPAAKTE